MSRPSTPLPFVLLFASLVALGRAAEPASRSATQSVRERVLQMTEFFDTVLPGVLEEKNMTLHFSPKFSDLRDNEYMRFPLELRYGLSDRLELRGGVVPFSPNPFNDGRDHRWGPGEGTLGARYHLAQRVPFFDDTTVGFDTRIPFGKPPIELNDHYTHVKPFVSTARQLNIWPNTTLYTNLSYDRSVKLTPRGTPPPPVLRRHILEVAPGLLFRPSEVAYFAEYRWRHITQPTDWHLGHEVRFGTIWDVPLARTEAWRLPGKWQLELGYKIAKEEGYDRDHGVVARVNWRTTLREVMNRAKETKMW